MSIAFYSAALSPYPSDRIVSARRLDPVCYPKWDGFCIKLGMFELTINWQRRGWSA